MEQGAPRLKEIRRTALGLDGEEELVGKRVLGFHLTLDKTLSTMVGAGGACVFQTARASGVCL
jgi:hypothetical protein